NKLNKVVNKKRIEYILKRITKRGPSLFIYLLQESPYYKSGKSRREIINKGLEKYPNNPDINKESALLYMDKRKWNQASYNWEVYFLNTKKTYAEDYLKLATCYEKNKKIKEAEKTIGLGLKSYPNHRQLLIKLHLLSIVSKDWELSISRLEEYIEQFRDKKPFKAMLKLSMILQLTGKIEESQVLFKHVMENYRDDILEEKLDHRKLTIFNKGDTVIHFYKSPLPTSKVVITFDSLNMTNKRSPLGFKLLKKQGVDIIAVRKRKKKKYQQDLSLEEFTETVQLLLKNYEDKIAYGFSLGAYLALYFTSNLNCRILAIAPRISAHPVYGKKGVIKKEDFNHKLFIDKNRNISPVILFDRRNKMDNKYINEQLKQVFPNGRFIEIPYGGHGMAKHLLNIGALKEYAITFIQKDKVPKYNQKSYRIKRSQSPNYLRLLAKTCFEHNKI